MKFSGACLRLPRIGLAIAMISLGACVKVGSKSLGAGRVRRWSSCNVEILEARVADELVMLHDRSAIEELLADYEVLRAQTRFAPIFNSAPHNGMVAATRTPRAEALPPIATTRRGIDCCLPEAAAR